MHALPFIPGCAYCTVHDLEEPKKECSYYSARTVTKKFRIIKKSHDPYHNLAMLLVAVHKEIDKIK